ncbi:hypothetical protein BU23DRAFT_508748 [Bimuria novae-zelandiae CBS 107.79]|uniref:Alcohol acetyltransferase n=1 Tax=Bimuria novae-zelandiae CBS 107.79 TaxID=1447943 RepID=A0A6A5V609_9PLEO|nr:hypothetical protein BU23DRAFT_508748 [Bimuria novae-zelandiae CBS 107.79]
MGSCRVTRPLGYNEQYELAQYTLGYSRGVSTACRLTVPGKVHQSGQGHLKSIIYRAIASVVSESPLLQATIKDSESKKPVWVHTGSVDLGKHVEWIELEPLDDRDGLLQEKIMAELDAEFADLTMRPAWRVAILQWAEGEELDVLFTWNHAHTDGMGGRIFLERLQASLILETQKETTTMMVTNLEVPCPDTPLRFPPSTELFVDLPMSMGFLLQQAWNETKPTSIFPNPNTATWAPIKTTPYKTNVRTFTVNNATLSGVLVACRSNQTTLTALLHGLILLSLASRLDEDAAPSFASLTAIDQRRFLPSHPQSYPWLEPSATIANYVTNTTHEFNKALVSQMRAQSDQGLREDEISDNTIELIWSASRRVRADMEARLQKGLRDDRLGLMKFVSNARTLFEKEVRKPRALSWAISNLGMMDGIPSRGGVHTGGEKTWEVRRAQFTLSAHVPDAALLIAAVSLKGGDLVTTCSWQDTVVEDTLAERVVKDLERWMTRIGFSVVSKA